MSDPLIISYNDSTIYQSDIDILKSPNQWLNDSIISFYLEWLKDSSNSSSSSSGNNNSNKIINDKILLLSPSVIFCCSLIESEQEIQMMFEQPLSMKTREYIFFPLNNNRDPNIIGGGSHWSLLIFVKSLNKFLYYDSINRFSNQDSLFVVSKFKFLLSSPSSPSNNSNNNLKQFIINQKTPQQQNSHDCGLYVLSIIEELLNILLSENNNKDSNNENNILLLESTNNQLINNITPNKIKEKRTEILNLILKLEKEKNKIK